MLGKIMHSSREKKHTKKGNNYLFMSSMIIVSVNWFRMLLKYDSGRCDTKRMAIW